jgi:hypothetical protein
MEGHMPPRKQKTDAETARIRAELY